MKILLVVEASGGVARHVVDLCRGIVLRGIEVHLIYSPLRMDSVLRCGLEELRQIGIETFPIAMKRQPTSYDIYTLMRIAAYASKHGPFDIIHGHSSKGGALVRLLRVRNKPAKLYTPHAFITMNPELSRLSYHFYRVVERVLSHLGHGLIATSKQELVHAKEVLGVPDKNLFLVPNGIRTVNIPSIWSDESIRTSLGIQPHEIVVGCIARLVPQKAPEILLRAFAMAVRRNCNLRLLMIGDGPLKEALMADCDGLGLADRVLWLGYVDGNKLMPSFDIFAMTSRYEGFPYVLLDAMSAGLPVLTTPFGGTEMVVHNEVNGIVVPYDSVQQTADAIVSMAGNAEMRRDMGKASRSIVEEYSDSRMVDETIQAYMQVLKQKMAE